VEGAGGRQGQGGLAHTPGNGGESHRAGRQHLPETAGLHGAFEVSAGIFEEGCAADNHELSRSLQGGGELRAFGIGAGESFRVNDRQMRTRQMRVGAGGAQGLAAGERHPLQVLGGLDQRRQDAGRRGSDEYGQVFAALKHRRPRGGCADMVSSVAGSLWLG